MNFRETFYDEEFDLAIFGLGFESRAISSLPKYRDKSDSIFAIGYVNNTGVLNYKKNKQTFEPIAKTVYEIDDSEIPRTITEIFTYAPPDRPLKILLDITVMSRHRLATVMQELISLAPKGSTICIVYSLSSFVPPPEGLTPVRKVCEITDGFGGVLGDLSLPTSVIIGLGYEKGKALGISNYLDSWRDYILVPKSPVGEFEKEVLDKNSDLIRSVPQQHIISYYVNNPYKTYLDLRSLVISLKEISRPHLIPLGPKILAAICVIIGTEFSSEVAVWRVSSEYEETPVERSFSGVEIGFSVTI